VWGRLSSLSVHWTFQSGVPAGDWKDCPHLLGKIGQRKKATPAQIALAWLLAQKSWVVPIPGTRKLERLVENIGAVAAELTPDDRREIDVAASKITVHGARYPEKLEQMTDR